jgi:hypothetical protein
LVSPGTTVDEYYSIEVINLLSGPSTIKSCTDFNWNEERGAIHDLPHSRKKITDHSQNCEVVIQHRELIIVALWQYEDSRVD